jgi:hypothetical protein
MGSAAGLAPEGSEVSPSDQYSTQQLEEMRAQLMNLADAVEQTAALAPPNLVDADSLRQARMQIQTMPYEHLNTLRKGISPSKLKARLTPAQHQLKTYADARAQGLAMSTNSSTKPSPRFTDGSAFPSPSGFCSSSGSSANPSSSGIGATGGSGTPPTVSTGSVSTGSDQSFTQDPSHLRIPTAVVIAADVVRFTADAIREFSQDACKEEILGFNASLVCIAVDALWVIADAIDEGIHFCDDDLTSNVIDTSYNGLADVHTDLYTIGTNLDTHLTNVNTDIDTKVANLDTHLANVNTDIDTRITNLDTHLTNVDNHIQTEFTTLSSLLTTLITNLSSQVGAATVQLSSGEQEIMKLVMTPDGLKVLNLSILTCDGTAAKPCPVPLAACLASGDCSWNHVGPLP